MAGGDVKSRNEDGLLHNVQGDGHQQNQQPYSQGDSNGKVRLLYGMYHGVYNDPIPLYTKAGHKENRTVHIAIEKTNENLAKCLSIYPVVAVYVIGYLQWKPDNGEEVSQGQIGHVNHSWVFLLGSEKEDPQCHDIAWQADHKYNCVDDGKKDSSQLSSKNRLRKVIYRKPWFHRSSILCNLG